MFRRKDNKPEESKPADIIQDMINDIGVDEDVDTNQDVDTMTTKDYFAHTVMLAILLLFSGLFGGMVVFTLALIFDKLINGT